MSKIFIGLTEIAGYSSNLKKGFQSIGHECVFISLTHHPFNFGGDDEPNIIINFYKFILRQKSLVGSKWMKVPFTIVLYTLRIPLFFWAITKYHIFIFIFGTSFFSLFDLPILKLLNKKIIFVFLGSDERPPYIDGVHHGKTVKELFEISRKNKNNIIKIERFADNIISYPSFAHFHEKKFINGLKIGLPFSFEYEMPKNEKINLDKNVRILHSPSDPIFKGTYYIRKAIAELQNKGYNIEFIEITKKPHQEVIEELQLCDFVVDQLYSDTPLAGLATEAAWFGKPAIVGGYYSEYIQNDYSPEEIPPSLFCHPDQITSAIERLIVDISFRKELGKEAQEFVRTQWASKQVALKYSQIIDGNIPEKWIADPHDINYIQGAGLHKHSSKENVRAIIEGYGIHALCLSDKPELEKLFLQNTKK